MPFIGSLLLLVPMSTPLGIVVRKVGGEKFDRIIKYTLPQEKPPAVGDLPETTLCETCTNSGYDNDFSLVCRQGWAVGGPCAHFEGVTDDVPF